MNLCNFKYNVLVKENYRGFKLTGLHWKYFSGLLTSSLGRKIVDMSSMHFFLAIL